MRALPPSVIHVFLSSCSKRNHFKVGQIEMFGQQLSALQNPNLPPKHSPLVPWRTDCWIYTCFCFRQFLIFGWCSLHGTLSPGRFWGDISWCADPSTSKTAGMNMFYFQLLAWYSMASCGSPTGKQFCTLCMHAGVCPCCCSVLWYQTRKWGRRSPASALGSSFTHIQTRWANEPARSVPGQVPSAGSPAGTHHHGRSCLPGPALLHLPAAAEHQNAGVFFRFNSKAASSIHQGPYSTGPSNPNGFCSFASVVPMLTLPCHPAHAIFPCPIPQVYFPLHSSYRAFLSSDPIWTVFGSHSPSLPVVRSLLLSAPSPPPKKSLCPYGAWS